MGADILIEAKKNDLTPEAYLNEFAAGVPAGCNGLYTVLNWLARPTHLHERGMMIGFNGTHKGPHMFRSIIEGIALTMKNHAQAMCNEREIEITNLIISGGGGGSNGDLFMQIFADVFGVKAHRNKVSGSAGLGAAICTALALGLYRNRHEAIDNMVCRKDTFTPHKENVCLYKEINESVYKEIVPRTDDLLKLSYQIFSK